MYKLQDFLAPTDHYHQRIYTRKTKNAHQLLASERFYLVKVFKVPLYLRPLANFLPITPRLKRPEPRRSNEDGSGTLEEPQLELLPPLVVVPSET